VTVTDRDALPPAPVQVREKVALANSTPVLAEPETGLLPDQPPEAAHAVAFVVLHCSVLAAPDPIELGVADREIVGAGVAGPVNVMSSTDNVRHAFVAVSVIANVWLPAGVETAALKPCHEVLDTFALSSDLPSRLTCTAGHPD
jgi:hypothetical protein